MTIHAEINRIQAYLREAARAQYESISIPPFTLFFHPTNPFKYFNYIIPDEPCGNLMDDGVLDKLRRAFRDRGRTARFEFFEAFAPDLPALLCKHGFLEEGRQWSMLCTQKTICSAPPLPGLEIVAINANSSGQDILDFIITQHQGFNPEDHNMPAESEVEQSKEGFGKEGYGAFLARMNGEPAGVAVFGQPIAGVSEITGIATREPFRRRGIATILTEHAARAAFNLGAQTACLTAADEKAGRVYEKVGFNPFSIMLAYIDHVER